MLLRLTSTCDWFLVVVQHPEKCHLQLSASPQSFYSLLTVASSAILHEVDQIFFFPAVIKKYSFTVGRTSPGRRKISLNSTRGLKRRSHELLYLITDKIQGNGTQPSADMPDSTHRVCWGDFLRATHRWSGWLKVSARYWFPAEKLLKVSLLILAGWTRCR